MRRWRTSSVWMVVAGLLIGCEQPPRTPPPAEAVEHLPPVERRADDGGWGYLIEKLVQDGVPRDRVERAFYDPRLPSFDGLEFALRPGESHAMYRHFLSPAKVAAARACQEAHAEAFTKAAERFQVSANVLTAIIFVESGCGRNTGRSPILYRLARLAMANEPNNLERNVTRLAVTNGAYDAEKAAIARRRGQYLEDTFYPEVRALFEIQRKLKIDPLSMRGSPSGAFGFPQFLPSSYVRYGVDGDGNGRVSLYDMDDAVASAANYFKGKGWRNDLPEAEQRRVVWEYNRSDAYIDTILGIAARLDAGDVAEVDTAGE